jgi:hypothetical protein
MVASTGAWKEAFPEATGTQKRPKINHGYLFHHPGRMTAISRRSRSDSDDTAGLVAQRT